jgi:3-hydroxyacyl-CoA dehydrogenase
MTVRDPITVVGAGSIEVGWAIVFAPRRPSRRRSTTPLTFRSARPSPPSSTVFATLDELGFPALTLASSSSMLGPSRFTSELSGRGRNLVTHPGNPPDVGGN